MHPSLAENFARFFTREDGEPFNDSAGKEVRLIWLGEAVSATGHLLRLSNVGGAERPKTA